MEKEKIKWAYVGDTQEAVDSKERKMIFIEDLGDRFLDRYVCVSKDDEDTFLKGGINVCYVGWKYAEIIKEAEYIPFEEGNIEDVKKIAGKVLVRKADGMIYISSGFFNQNLLNRLFKTYTFEDGSPIGKLREE